ncbi:unnamed protein product [Caenorhabditis nigoni]
MGSKLQHLEYLEIVIFPLIDLESFSDEVYQDLNPTENVEDDGRPMTVVVLFECIENLDVLEIIIFSLLSKRAKSIAKLIRLNLLDIHITSEGDPQIWFKVPNVPGLDWVIDYNKQYESSVYPAFRSSLNGPKAVNFLILHDNGNVIEDVKQMVEHICEVFRSQISDIVIFDESLIEWIIKFQPTIGHVRIREDVISSVETMERILKSLKVTDFLGLEPLAIDEKFKTTEPILSRFIVIFSSFWVTLPSILNGTNSIIRLYDSKLSGKDINTILKEWQMGTKLRNLKYLEIEFIPIQENTSYYEILEDLDWTDYDENDGRPRTVEIDDDWIITLPMEYSPLNLIRSDGMIGSIVDIGSKWFGEVRKTRISFVVWSKQS